VHNALFNACRSLIFVDPHQSWNNIENLFEISHTKLSFLTKDIIAKLNKEIAYEIHTKTEKLRNERELFSYSFPANGQGNQFAFDEVVECCGVVSELAELTGFRIQNFIERHYLKSEDQRKVALKTWQNTSLNGLKAAYTYQNDTFIDREDWYRIDYINRKIKKPSSIIFTLTEGMTEDFFGAWLPDEADQDNDFNPYNDCNIIFPIP
jgi:hypothetical protein